MRFSTHLVLFLLIANSMIGAAAAIGMWEDWGINPVPGLSDSQTEDIEENATSIQAQTSGADSLLTLFTGGAETMGKIMSFAWALPTFLQNIGVPSEIAAIPNAVLGLLIGRDVLQIMLGRDI